MGRNHAIEEGKINGLIDKGCSMEGKLAFDGSVQINGSFRGEIISDGTLVVGPEANVEGRIRVGNIIIEGNVQGTVDAKGKMELRKGSRLVADIQTPTIVIEEGALYHGQCKMVNDAERRTSSDQIAVDQLDTVEDTGDSLMM